MSNNKTLAERIVDSARTGRSDPDELSILDNITASAAEINLLEGVTATTEARCSALRDELHQATGAISMIDMFILRLESSGTSE